MSKKNLKKVFLLKISNMYKRRKKIVYWATRIKPLWIRVCTTHTSFVIYTSTDSLPPDYLEANPRHHVISSVNILLKIIYMHKCNTAITLQIRIIWYCQILGFHVLLIIIISLQFVWNTIRIRPLCDDYLTCIVSLFYATDSSSIVFSFPAYFSLSWSWWLHSWGVVNIAVLFVFFSEVVSVDQIQVWSFLAGEVEYFLEETLLFSFMTPSSTVDRFQDLFID